MTEFQRAAKHASLPVAPQAGAPCKWAPEAPKYDRLIDFKIEELKLEGRYRYFRENSRMLGEFPHSRLNTSDGERRIVVWCSNDYLGMGQHPVVLAAMEEALHSVGAGSGGTRNISGTTHYHVALEREIADLHAKEAARRDAPALLSARAGEGDCARGGRGARPRVRRLVASRGGPHRGLAGGTPHQRFRCPGRAGRSRLFSTRQSGARCSARQWKPGHTLRSWPAISRQFSRPQ